MARVASCLPLAFLFLASVIPSEAQKAEADAEAEESRVTVALGAPLTVECRLRAEQRAEWQRDGAAPPPDMRAAPEAAAAPDARLAARLRAPHARAYHAGTYTCAADRRHRVRVVVLPAGEEPSPSPAAAAAAAASDAPPEVLYDVRGNFTLLCPLANDKSLQYVCLLSPPTSPSTTSAASDAPPEVLYDVRGNFTLLCPLANDKSLHLLSPPTSPSTTSAASDAPPEVLYDVRGNFTLLCPLANDKSLHLLSPPTSPSTTSAASDAPPEVLYDVRGNFTLLCPLANDKSLHLLSPPTSPSTTSAASDAPPEVLYDVRVSRPVPTASSHLLLHHRQHPPRPTRRPRCCTTCAATSRCCARSPTTRACSTCGECHALCLQPPLTSYFTIDNIRRVRRAARGAVRRARQLHAAVPARQRQEPAVRVVSVTPCAYSLLSPPTSPPTTSAASDAPPEVLYDVRGNFTLLCPLANDKSLQYVWRKNETEISLVWDKERYSLERGGAEFRLARTTEEDFGNYSCALPGAGEARWAVRGRPHLKLPANTNVVEGQKLKLTCRVTGKPYARVEWSYSNASDDKGPYVPLDDSAVLADSDAGAPDAVLLLAAAARRHAGYYRCSAPGALLNATTTLRVKDMYAALWPFLGICAEVFVLCAIILLYERRRTKPDLDDSDTDNHDQ
ncbi:uncharacterized protein Bsg [Maniola hyperantus]|uniref:uncharacterized protein Bsg n=1 Tax=Aphantopus hyperantus TaxID=2795564 RepID=UPI00374A6C99